MAGTFTAAAREAAAEAVTVLGPYISLHTADPGTTGANEVTGGGYTRVPTTWPSGDAVDGVQTGSTVEITVGAGTYSHYGIWSAASGGTFVTGSFLAAPGSPTVPAPVTVSGAGAIRVTPTVGA